MAQPELTKLEADIEELRKQNYDLEVQLRIVRGQLPRVQNAPERQLQDEVMRLGDQVTQLQSERVQFATALEESNTLAERLMAEKTTIKKEFNANLEELKDKLVKVTHESNENYRLYVDQKDHNVLLKADLDRIVAIGGRPSMDMSTATSDGNMSIMSERDKELMRLTSTVFQTKVDAEKKSRELQDELDKAKEQIGKRDDMIRQLLSKNSSTEKKVKEVENLLQQERSMYRTYMDRTDAPVRHSEEDGGVNRSGGDHLGLQSQIEELAERHLNVHDQRSISESVAQLYSSQADLPNASVRPDDSIMSTTYNNMSLSFAFNQIAVAGSGDIDQLARIADVLFKKLRATAGTLKAILGHANPHVVELEASIRELETSIHTSFVEGVGSVKKELDRLQTQLAKKKEEVSRLGEEVTQLQSERDRFATDLEKSNNLAERLMAEKHTIEREFDTELEELKDKLVKITRERDEKHRLHEELKDKLVKITRERDEVRIPLADCITQHFFQKHRLHEELKDKLVKITRERDEKHHLHEELKGQNALLKEDLDRISAIAEQQVEQAVSEFTPAPSVVTTPAAVGWSIAKCAERLDRVDASANNIVQLLKGVGTLPVLPHTLETMMTFGRQARDDAYKCAKFLRAFDKENQSQNTIMSDKVRETLEKELKSINKVLKTTAENARRLNTK
ncbi:hypothetical protein QR680_016370 [Steinernema hermaphroditum]|uniref:Uncharacterized protein n=1 Tax=Steinernema hermaphroditum TaxID=289476 RepID=A0AA39HB07_9BILA|nr:hypothetical protein QR680_016370 [Steinernema hermaphroditum]